VAYAWSPKPSGWRREATGTAITPREQEVAALVARGKTNRRIAEELHLSERTVATYVGRVLKKLGLRHRDGVAEWVCADTYE
jgi:DNA-binding NarL/FixJ family response regulator